MAQNEFTVPFTGNLVNDPELRFTPAGVAVANLTVAVTPQTWDKDQGKFVDGNTVWWPCTVWKDFAENVAESLKKGMRVTGHGRIRERSFETKDGQKRSVKELEIDAIGPDLRFARAQVTRTGNRQESGGFGGGQSGFGGGQPSGGFGNDGPAYRDPGQSGGYDQWSTSQPGGGDRWSQ